MDLNETRERIIYQKEGPIAKITLNWPEKANAQDQKLAEEVDAALLDADRDYDIKVLVLKANGKGLVTLRKSVPKTSLITSVAIRKKPQVRSSVSNGRS